MQYKQDHMESLPDIITRCLTQHQERVEQRKNFLHPDTAAQALQPPHTPTPMFNTPSMQFPHSRLVFKPFNTKYPTTPTTTSATSNQQQIQQQHPHQNQTENQFCNHYQQNHFNHFYYPYKKLPLIPPFKKSILPQTPKPMPTPTPTPPPPAPSQLSMATETPSIPTPSPRHFNANLANQ
ncbi:hypothetical protein DOY81_003370 [Sarcophaga bullata]|nr:hypothetical protein DOY81_003370 [Sarcophaga bullata]